VDQIIVIDDGSVDKTEDQARSGGAFVIRHDVNKGVGASFCTGLEYVLEKGFDIMVNIDGDGQFSPLDIPKLIDPIIEGDSDFVTASRFIDPKLTPDIPKIKRWGNQWMSMLISWLIGRRFYDVSCGFRSYSRETLMKLNLLGSFTYTQESFIDLAFKGVRIKEVPVKVKYFKNRKSRVSLNLFYYAFQTLKIILRSYRDYRPLRFFWSIAGLLMLISIFFSSILLVHYIRTGIFSGQIWSGFVGAFFFMNAIGFFLMGIIADILHRIRINQERILYKLKKLDSPKNADDTHRVRN